MSIKETDLNKKTELVRPISSAVTHAPAPIDWQHLERQLAETDRKTDRPDSVRRGTASRIRAIILAGLQSGTLAPGARLKEVELGNALQVSRTPLREALTRLKTERILESDGDGLRIRKLEWADIRSLYELRATLEGLAARLTAQRASPAEKQFIDQLVVEERRLIEEAASPEILARHNRRFHNSICKAAGNHFLEEQLTQLAQMMVLLGVTAYSMHTRLASILAEHEQINLAIQNNTAEAAEHAMRAHLEAALTARLHLISQADLPQMD